MARDFDTSEFKRALAKVPAAIRREVAAAHEKSAGEFVAMAKRFAPKDNGDLVESIRHERTETGGQIVRAGGAATTRPVRSGVKATFDYALAQEFGTARHPAQPFFWPTYRLIRKRINSRRRRAIAKALKDSNNG